MKKIIVVLLLVVGLFDLAFSQNVKRSSSYNYNRGIEAIQNGDNEEALEYFRRELQDNPNNGYALFWIGCIFDFQDDYGKALLAMDVAIKKLPKKDKETRSFVYTVRAGIYIKLEEPEKALADLKSAITETPKDADVYEKRADIYYDMGKYDLSDKDYREIISIDPWNVIGYMGLGRNAKQQGKYEEAIELFDYVVKIDPKYSSGYSFRSDCYIAQTKYTEAIDDIITALSLDVDVKAHHNLMTMGKVDLPLTTIKLQIQAANNPNESVWYYCLGQIHYQNGLFRKAVSFYEKALHLDAKPVILENIADSYFALGEYSKALEYINQAICKDETDYDFIMKKGNIYNEMGRYPEAIAELDKYIKEYPGYFFGYYCRGWIKDEAKDIEGAIEDYTFAITLNPTYAYSYCGRGRLYDKQGKQELARADFEKVIELDTVPNPGESCAHYAFNFLGEKAEAIAFMEGIIAKEDDRSESYYGAACLYSIMNEKEKALDYLTKAFEHGYRRIAHMYADEDLDNIRDTPEYKILLEKYTDDSLEITTIKR